ncbi:MAG: signal peptidase I [Acutalibacteraceae bacterium]|nr:signal peptidase I [Acutalibacteraceae bacterium]
MREEFKYTDVAQPEESVAEQPEVAGAITQSCYDMLHTIILPITVVFLLLTFVFRLVNVDGQSMMDTLFDKDKVIVTNFLYTPKSGDVVVISHGQQLYEPIIKRVIATEGQSLSIDFAKGTVAVDGVILDEPYIKESPFKQYDAEIPEVIPEGMVFVMGDNRNHSTDSRSTRVGLINEDDVIGKAQFILYPFNRIKLL